jgi:RNA polymerase sigma factor (sigma-70 family)
LGSVFSTADIVQEVFLSVVRGIREFEGRDERTFESYLVTLTRNRLVDAVRFHEALRRDQRRLGEIHRDMPDATPDPAFAAGDADELRRFHAVLHDLRDRDRALLRGRLEDGESFETLARQLGYASSDSARKCFHVALAGILVRLGRAGADRSAAGRGIE